MANAAKTKTSHDEMENMTVVELPPSGANKRKKAVDPNKEAYLQLRAQLKSMKQGLKAAKLEEENSLPPELRAFKNLKRTTLRFIRSVRKEDWETAQGLLENELGNALREVITSKQ